MQFNKIAILVLFILALNLFPGCSSTPPVKQQNYGQLNHQRTYEYSFSEVWKGIEEALRNYKITDRNPSEVSSLEMKSLTERSLETDWIYTQSRDKYQEYTVNGSPRKIYLQTRYKYFVVSKNGLGGPTVTVKTEEEVERLNSDGTSAGFTQVSNQDPSRPNELLDKIKLAILSAPAL